MSEIQYVRFKLHYGIEALIPVIVGEGMTQAIIRKEAIRHFKAYMPTKLEITEIEEKIEKGDITLIFETNPYLDARKAFGKVMEQVEQIYSDTKVGSDSAEVAGDIRRELKKFMYQHMMIKPTE